MDSGKSYKLSFKKDDAIESVVKQFQQHFTKLCIEEKQQDEQQEVKQLPELDEYSVGVRYRVQGLGLMFRVFE